LAQAPIGPDIREPSKPGNGEGGLVGVWPDPLAPVGNEQDPLKERLGKLLFWEEQVSSDGTMACGTCHIPAAGGSDPRTTRHPASSSTPKRFGSPGVIRQDFNGDYVVDADFLLDRQITGRLAPTPYGAAFFQKLFWDVSADETFPFQDVNGDLVLLTESAALESLSLRPPTSPVEMGHDLTTWSEIEARLPDVVPMALASELQGDFVVARDATYGDLFEEAFSSPGVTRGRFAMAVAQYMRTLIPNEAPIDGGFATMSPEAQLGFQVFNTIETDFGHETGCTACHQHFPTDLSETTIQVDESGLFLEMNDYLFSGGATSDGLVDPKEDRDLIFAKTATLRNVALMPRLESQGRFAGIEAALDQHYFDNDQTSRTFGDGTEVFREELLAFFDALVDPRVADETAPFDRPVLYSEVVPYQSNLEGSGSKAPGQRVPLMIANTPPLIGNPDFKFGVGMVPEGSLASLYSSDASVPPPGGPDVQWEIDTQSRAFGLEGTVTRDGQTEVLGLGGGTLHTPIDDPALAGETRYYQWIVQDSDAPGGFATSKVARVTYF